MSYSARTMKTKGHFERQDWQDGKKQKENYATKVTKIPKTKRRKYGMNET